MVVAGRPSSSSLGGLFGGGDDLGVQAGAGGGAADGEDAVVERGVVDAVDGEFGGPEEAAGVVIERGGAADAVHQDEGALVGEDDEFRRGDLGPQRGVDAFVGGGEGAA